MAVIRNLVVKIAADISSLTSGLTAAQKKLNTMANSFAKIGTTLSLAITTPLVTLAKQAVSTASAFEQSMANANSVAGGSAEELQQMTDLARELGATTVFSASQAAMQCTIWRQLAMM